MKRKRVVLVAGLLAAALLSPAQTALALSCPTGHVGWIEAYNSADGTYKQVSWEGGSRYFPGTGTDYVNTGRRTNAYANVSSDSDQAFAHEFCVPGGVDL